MDYKQAHRRNFISEKPIASSAIVPGAIITFNYVDENKKFSKKMVLVLNPRWEHNLHGITLEVVRPKVLQEITNLTKLWYSRKLNEIAKLRLPLLKVNVGNPKIFYQSTFKNILGMKLKNVDCYREFVTTRMTNIKIIEYALSLQEKLNEAAIAKGVREHARLLKKQRGT